MAVLFISDLHLSSSRRGSIRSFSSFSASVQSGLGSLHPRRPVRVLGGRRRHRDPFKRAGRSGPCGMRPPAARRILVMHGNRDFLFGPAFAQRAAHNSSTTRRARPVRQKTVLTHGDALCTDDREYQAFRVEVRSESWKRAFLAQPLPSASGASRHCALGARSRRSASQPRSWTSTPARWSRCCARTATHASSTATPPARAARAPHRRQGLRTLGAARLVRVGRVLVVRRERLPGGNSRERRSD